MRSRKLSLALAAGLAALWLPAEACLAAFLPVTPQFEVLMGKVHAGTSSEQLLLLPVSSGQGFGNSWGGIIATLQAGVLAGNAAVSLPVPISPTFFFLTRVTVPANSAGPNPVGSFDPNGAMGLGGAFFFHGAFSVAVPLAPIGGGGSVALTFGGIPGTLVGATWMGGTQIFSLMDAVIAVPISARATAFDNRSVGGFGQMQLVAPARIALGVLGALPTFGVLTLFYTPEPGTLTLLGAGVAALAAVGRRKQRAAKRR